MGKREARRPAFSRLSDGLQKRKKSHKEKRHRANRKRLRQAIDIETHVDKPLDSWAVD